MPRNTLTGRSAIVEIIRERGATKTGIELSESDRGFEKALDANTRNNR